MRIGLNGQPRVAVDRANSFVGTAEYIVSQSVVVMERADE
jgi:hypothetical protein